MYCHFRYPVESEVDMRQESYLAIGSINLSWKKFYIAFMGRTQVTLNEQILYINIYIYIFTNIFHCYASAARVLLTRTTQCQVKKCLFVETYL